MSSLPLFKIPRAILAHAKSFIVGEEASISPAPTQDAPVAPQPQAGVAWSPGQDKDFWAAMAGADRRLADLRRAIDQAAAEAIAREAEAAPGPDVQLGESRYGAANRMITDALDAEKS